MSGGVNDLHLVLDRAGALLDATKDDGLSLADRAGLYAAARFLMQDVHRHIDSHFAGNSYAHEKAAAYLWHLGAVLGFDVTNGHNAGLYRSWGDGALTTLTNVLDVPPP